MAEPSPKKSRLSHPIVNTSVEVGHYQLYCVCFLLSTLITSTLVDKARLGASSVIATRLCQLVILLETKDYHCCDGMIEYCAVIGETEDDQKLTLTLDLRHH